jgi:cell division protein FtsL
VFSLAVVASLAVGLVCLNAMRIDAAYEAHVVEEHVRSMLEERRTLENDVARLSSPSRVGGWARRNGLVHPAPGEVVILQVRRVAGTPG